MAATTFLQHLQRFQRESGSGNVPITTVLNLTGEGLRLKDQIQQATKFIQTAAGDWNFLYVFPPAPITTGAGTSDYVGPSDLNLWNRKAFRIDGRKVPRYSVLDYDAETFPTAQSGRPSRIFILPNNRLRLWPTPDAAYEITYEYWQKYVPFAESNTDVSIIPDPYDELILYKALEYYATFEDAPEIMEKAMKGWEEWWPKLEAHEKPNHTYGLMSDDNDIVIVAE
jgi:hypothetical protein